MKVLRVMVFGFIGEIFFENGFNDVDILILIFVLFIGILM